MAKGGGWAWAVGLFIAIGASFVLVAWLAGSSRLPRNRWIGIRTPTTYASDDSWAVAHRAAAPWVAFAGFLNVAYAAGVAGFQPDTAATASVVTAGTVMTVVVVLMSWRAAERA